MTNLTDYLKKQGSTHSLAYNIGNAEKIPEIELAKYMKKITGKLEFNFKRNDIEGRWCNNIEPHHYNWEIKSKFKLITSEYGKVNWKMKMNQRFYKPGGYTSAGYYESYDIELNIEKNPEELHKKMKNHYWSLGSEYYFRNNKHEWQQYNHYPSESAGEVFWNIKNLIGDKYPLLSKLAFTPYTFARACYPSFEIIEDLRNEISQKKLILPKAENKNEIMPKISFWRAK